MREKHVRCFWMPRQSGKRRCRGAEARDENVNHHESAAPLAREARVGGEDGMRMARPQPGHSLENNR